MELFKLNELFEAPCVFCGYNGPGYYQVNTHAKNCPFCKIGGANEREHALVVLAKKGWLKVVKRLNIENKSEPDFYGKWFETKNKLPEYQAYAGSEQFVHVLVCVNGCVGQGMYCNGKWEFMGMQNVDVTHWMPLPDPPPGEEE